MSLPHLILGILDQWPVSGYDLNKIFSSTIQHFWSTDQSQIYRALYKLEEQGWVEAENIIQFDSPNKKVYHVTPDGQQELKRWLTTPLPDEPLREDWLGQIFFASMIDRDEIIALLQVYHNQIEQRWAALKAIEQAFAQFDQSDVPLTARFQRLTLDYGIRRFEFEMAWIKRTFEELSNLPTGAPTANDDST